MTAQLRRRGELSGPRIAAAMARVPRHVFVPGAELAEAYADQAIATRYRDGVPTSAASQPAIVAAMLDLLRPPAGGSVLEVGAGTGYNAALLSQLVGSAGRVVTIDIDRETAAEARDHLAVAGVSNVTVICGDGALGWPSGAPYDGIIVTAGTCDLAPAWIDQLTLRGRLVVPLSIRGVQQCMAFTRADGHLRSIAVCECGFMPLAGAMAGTDRRLPVPGHPGVYLQAAADTHADIGVVAKALDNRGPKADIGITASGLEVFGSLRRWLALRDEAAALLTYIGPPDAAAASGVPPVLGFPLGGAVQQSSPCILGPDGLAALDLAGPPAAELQLAVRSYGQADQRATQLGELVTAWHAAGRPGAGRLQIDAYPAGLAPPGAEGIVHTAQHVTFVLSSL